VTTPEIEADWLQETLADVARRLRRPGVSGDELAKCASILERIVGDLRGTPMESSSKANQSGTARWWIIAIIGFALFVLMRRLSRGDRHS
jgi:hypothetical protein